jgi:hypothetical protein
MVMEVSPVAAGRGAGGGATAPATHPGVDNQGPDGPAGRPINIADSFLLDSMTRG